MSDKKPVLVFQSDFTYLEGAVASMYGVVKSVDPDLEIMTATHQLPRYDIWSASYRLKQYVPFWPPGTVFVSVVDPGVGTSRRACIALLNNGSYVVSPDNGTLTHISENSGIREVRIINSKTNYRQRERNTVVFDGRDVFAYAAARLAAGIICYEETGPDYPLNDIVRFPLSKALFEEDGVHGIIEIADPNFGNLWTNISADNFLKCGFQYGDKVIITLLHRDKVFFKQEVIFGRAFASVHKGEPVLYTNELINLALALNQKSFLAEYKAGWGDEWKISIQRHIR